MTKHNPDNERTKRAYFAYLKEARRQSDLSIAAVAKALSRFEEATKYRAFQKFHAQQAVAFKRRLTDQTSAKTGENLSKSTLHSTLQALRNFFLWLAGQPGFKSRISYSDADYFNISESDRRIARAERDMPVPRLDQIHYLLSVMPATTDIQRRNRALIAFTLLTGARDRALASLRLKHVDLVQGCLRQDAREVRTKFSKSFVTTFFPVGGAAGQITSDWVAYLREVLHWGEDDPLFPATRIAVGAISRQFEAAGVDSKFWSTAAPIRAIFRDAFERAGLSYFNPHSFRKTLAQLGEQLCKTPEDFKAWSQNLGHEGVLTTFASYGAVPSTRQAAIIKDLGQPVVQGALAMADRVARLEAALDGRLGGGSLRLNTAVSD